MVGVPIPRRCRPPYGLGMSGLHYLTKMIRKWEIRNSNYKFSRAKLDQTIVFEWILVEKIFWSNSSRVWCSGCHCFRSSRLKPHHCRCLRDSSCRKNISNSHLHRIYIKNCFLRLDSTIQKRIFWRKKRNRWGKTWYNLKQKTYLNETNLKLKI